MSKKSGGLQAKIQRLQSLFKQCDKDGDNALQEPEFKAFFQLAQKRSCPPNLYGKVCQQLQIPVENGLTWEHVYAIFASSNAKQTKSKSPQSNGSSMASPRNAQGRKSRVSGIGGRRGTGLGGSGGSALTEGSLRRHDEESLGGTPEPLPGSPADHGRQESTGSDAAAGPHIPRASSLHRKRSIRGSIGTGLFDTSNDSSGQMLALLEKKLNGSRKDLAKERQGRKQADELNKQLVVENTTLKNKVKDLQGQIKRVTTESKASQKRMDDLVKKKTHQLSTLKSQMDNDRTVITHLKSQKSQMQSERDEAFKLLRKVEKEHDSRIKKLKEKQKREIERIMDGLRISLGGKQGEDIRKVVKDLRSENESMRKQVDMLAESLSRKDHSLVEALSAVDDMSKERAKNEEVIAELMANALLYSDGNSPADLDGLQPTGRTSRGKKLKQFIQKKSQPSWSASSNGTGSKLTPRNGRMAGGGAGGASSSGLGMHGTTERKDSGSSLDSEQKRPMGNGYGGVISPNPVGSGAPNGSGAGGTGGSQPVHRKKRRASFFKSASTDHPKLQLEAGGNNHGGDSELHLTKLKLASTSNGLKESASKSKQMEFLSKRLASDIVSKQSAIDQLSSANEALIDKLKLLNSNNHNPPESSSSVPNGHVRAGHGSGDLP